MTGIREISLDELPQFSPWIKYILGQEPLHRNLSKTAESLNREYGIEKWGSLLQSIEEKKIHNLEDADRFFFKDVPAAFFEEGKLWLDSSVRIQERYFNHVRKSLEPHLSNSGHLIELGTGYGTLILKLARHNSFKDSRFTGADFTTSGVACLERLIGNNEKINSAYCDLNSLSLKEINPDPGSVIMTSWTLGCLKGFYEKTVREIIKYKPSMVIHFEPVIQHWPNDKLLSSLWRRYLELNDYNLSFYSDLKMYESQGLLKIVQESPNVFGANPLAPVSVLKWVPCL